MTLWQGDCMDRMREITDGSVDLLLADPPYNIGVQTKRAGKKRTNAWDKIENYDAWTVEWVKLACQKLKQNGVAYIWQGDAAQMAQVMEALRRETPLVLRSLCIWDKGGAHRAKSWKNRDPDGAASLRSWFSVCEYCLHYFLAPAAADAKWNVTGLDRIYSNSECFAPLKQWYAAELARLGITEKDIAEKYTEVTGKKPYMLHHYFQNSQFEIPTQEVWEAVYMPLGFRRGNEDLRREYEDLRREYENLRNYHRCDAMHCNVWHVPPIPSTGRLHTCQKPVEILRRIIRVSCPPGGVVLDPFMGAGSTGVACLDEAREFIGIERDEDMYRVACERIAAAEAAGTQMRIE